ncbi:hypothetical protein NP493_460g00024 [Ridgeia piscesae]|uniref:Mutator-like transposase domain-containing protein n=1 Tax=Ridgeia piscesae TaxID=27915 RepID=A0AAD9KYI6_RIDPI|nr:hypothetical protein NP493_460g00024 [Ridgeia piscesae]
MLDDAATVVDLTVNYDGSWMNRVHKSQYGIDCVVEVITGLVIDLQHPTRRQAHNSLKEWYVTHEPECNQNYEGASGGTEVKAAELLWTRSTSDTPSFSPTVTPGPSPASPTCKCTATWSCRRRSVNHVAKRLNTALRKFGKLTEKTIETLSQYYRMAVQARPHDVNGMQNAILAPFNHYG